MSATKPDASDLGPKPGETSANPHETVPHIQPTGLSERKDGIGDIHCSVPLPVLAKVLDGGRPLGGRICPSCCYAAGEVRHNPFQGCIMCGYRVP